MAFFNFQFETKYSLLLLFFMFFNLNFLPKSLKDPKKNKNNTDLL